MQYSLPGSRIVVEETVQAKAAACDYLAKRTGLSKGRVKDAMNKGALRIKKGGKGSMQRLRRATAELGRGDQIAFYYDETLLTLVPLEPECVADEGRYSVWYKPAGMLSQGNEYGDHCSLLRQAELMLEPRRETLLVHRLDRPATGLMVIAHEREIAAKLSSMFSAREVFKRYRVMVKGEVGAVGDKRTIEAPLDGKDAISHVEVLQSAEGMQLLDVVIDTGRRHQIRRHLADIGAPIVGDREYGGAPSPMLCLTCVELAFACPVTRAQKRFQVLPQDVEWLD